MKSQTRLSVRSINQSNRPISVRLSFLFCSRAFISRSYENRFPFVTTNRSGRFRQNSSARSVKSLVACMKKLIFEQKLLEKAYFTTGAAGKRAKIIGRPQE